MKNFVLLKLCFFVSILYAQTSSAQTQIDWSVYNNKNHTNIYESNEININRFNSIAESYIGALKSSTKTSNYYILLKSEKHLMIYNEKFSLQNTSTLSNLNINKSINIDDHFEFYAYDSVRNIFHDIKNTIDFPNNSPKKGVFKDNLELKSFNGSALSNDDFVPEETNIQFYNNNTINNIKSIELENMIKSFIDQN